MAKPDDDRRDEVTVTFVLPDKGSRRPDCTRTPECLLYEGHPSPTCLVPNNRRHARTENNL